MKKYDVAQLDDLFIEAGRTELMLPPVKMKTITNSWMDIKEDWHHYNPKYKRPLKLRPTTKQITRYEEALSIGLKLPVEDRKVIWASSISAQRRHRPNWSELGRRFKKDRRTVQNDYRGALMKAWLVQDA